MNYMHFNVSPLIVKNKFELQPGLMLGILCMSVYVNIFIITLHYIYLAGNFIPNVYGIWFFFQICTNLIHFRKLNIYIISRDTNSMVEEFMLLANISTAEKIQEEFPNCAVLRRHPAPPPSNFDPLIKAALSKVREMSYLW